MTAIPCPYCGTVSPHYLQTRDYNRHIKDEVYHYYRCPQDGLIFLHPIPPNLGDYYPPSYYELTATKQPTIHPMDREKLHLVNQYGAGKRLLEVGPGSGGFAYLAKVAGYDVNAIEMDQAACEYLKIQLSIPCIHAADVVKAIEAMGQFDIIALWQVIEHVPSFDKILATLVGHLNPNGILILAAPNPEALQFRLLQQRWFHLDAPRHLQLIPLTLLTDLVQRYQLVEVLQTTTHSTCLDYNRMGWQGSLRILVTKRLQMLTLARMITWTLQHIEQRPHRGATYITIWKKP